MSFFPIHKFEKQPIGTGTKDLLSFVLLAAITVFLASCKQDAPEASSTPANTGIANANAASTPLFEFLPPESTQIDFQNKLIETEGFNFLLYNYFYNGAGVAVGDINNDGLDDIYFAGNTVANRLYLNLGNFKFRDITESANVKGGQGFKTGVSMVDINGDGLLDIYVCRSALPAAEYRRNLVYINNGDLTFTERARELGLDDPGNSVQAYFFDSDGDRDLDVFVLNHPASMKEANNLRIVRNDDGSYTQSKPEGFELFSDHLYENRDGVFVDVTSQAGMLSNAFGLSAVVGDFNEDHQQDLYVGNDYIQPDFLFINRGRNRFKNELDTYFSSMSFSTMGSDYADMNNDGLLDLMTLDMLPRENDRRKMMMPPQNYDKFQRMLQFDFLGAQYTRNTLQINTGLNHFSNISFLDNLAQTDWSWSVLLADFDNDGLKDVHVTNGYYRDVTDNDYANYELNKLDKQLRAKEITLLEWLEHIPSQAVSAFLFKNRGAYRFDDVSSVWDSGPPSFSNGAAYSDLDNDGFLDLVVSNINGHPFIMKNRGSAVSDNSYLSVELESPGDAALIGTKASLQLSDGSVITEFYSPVKGFQSSSQHRLHFGIRKGLEAVHLTVCWPDGESEIYNTPGSNKRIAIKKGGGRDFQLPKKKGQRFFEDATTLLPEGFAHQENMYVDFKREVLLHRKFSEEGPAVAIGDVNSDGRDDVFIGGAAGSPSRLFMQTANGGFSLIGVSDFEADALHEDTDALFFDANGDDLPDLYVVSGGNEYEAGSANYRDRLYINQGDGNFKAMPGALPDIFLSGAVVRTHDIDSDGQPDLFIGGRVIPGRYPEAPGGRILKNVNGVFRDVTDTLAPDLKDIGMLTDARFHDLDNDGLAELILAGEWMPVTILKYDNGSYVDRTREFGLDGMRGWWNTIGVADVNGDGFADILGGNLGLNSFFKATANKPATLYYKDFDQNGSLDAVLCTYIDGRSYPVHGRDRLVNQLVMLKKRFTRYAHYADASIEEVFTKEELRDAGLLQANHFAHTLFLNQEGSSFSPVQLPVETQFSVINDFMLNDIDGDGTKDIVAAGNFYGTDAEFGRYDSSIGSVLLQRTPGAFEAISPLESGLRIGGDVRAILPITIKERPYILVSRNNDRFGLISQK